MKKNTIFFLLIALLFGLGSCEKFLDTMPDNRAEINSVEKVTKLLVSAYPTNSGALIAELSSDNAMDNGTLYTPYNREQEDAYLWRDITTTGNDAPKAIWDGHYGAIAAANQALNAIEELENPVSLNAQKGEALIARAYAHFALANLFCMPYNPETANSDLGLPYSEKPETQVKVEYQRGTMAELYEKISTDIEAGLSLINDEIYSVPKYHFNKRAAYAFAARFNLFYLKFDKAVQYATTALGDNPATLLGKWTGMFSAASNWDVRNDMYISASDAGNFLILPAYSSLPYVLGPYNLGRRYGNARPIIERESFRAAGIWGPSRDNVYLASAMWGYDQKFALPKVGAYFEYIDKVAGIGYIHSVLVPFTAGETLLCRAEAYILQSKFAEATADINTWIKANAKPSVGAFSQDEIVSFYKGLSYMPVQIKNDNERSIKKKINPQGFTVTEDVQENLIQCILHLRRMETMHDGGRWYDLKRYGIEIAHNREGEADDVLLKDDPRRAIQLPQDVISAGLQANPRK
ncbi:MAG TPA: hypothetical protein DDW85_10705 [Porphyromonadaceae bacterium]|nr:hypothetical protein [Porphyromonadaceae bacterium]